MKSLLLELKGFRCGEYIFFVGDLVGVGNYKEWRVTKITQNQMTIRRLGDDLNMTHDSKFYITAGLQK